jgi:hypothetical protein
MSTAATAAKPAAAKAPAKVAAPKATYSATTPQSDQQLQASAHDIADTQVNGGLQSLAQVIAQNNAQAAAAQAQTANLYQGLGQNVNASNQQIGQIGSGLNTTLAGIGDQTQSTLGAAYQPSAKLTALDSQGLGGGGVQALAQALANAKGGAAQDSQAFRSAGATQGANYGQLGASQLGTGALKGEEALTAIQRAAQGRDNTSNTSMVNLEATRGPLYEQALSKLTTAESNLELAKASLGIKDTTAQTGATNAQTAAAAQKATATHLTNTDSLATQKLAATTQYQQALLGIRQIDAQLAQGNLSEKTRNDLANNRIALQKIRAAGAPGSVAKITTGERKAGSTLVSNVNALVGEYKKGGIQNTHGVTQTALTTGGFTTDEANIARDLAVLGHVSPQNRAAALRIVGGQASLLPPAWGI